MIDFKFFEFAFCIEKDFSLILGSVLVGGLILGIIIYSITAFLNLFTHILNNK